MIQRQFEKAIYTIRVLAVAVFVILTLFLTIKGQAFVYDVEGPCSETTLSGHDWAAEIEKTWDREMRPDRSPSDRNEADRGYEKGNLCIN